MSSFLSNEITVRRPHRPPDYYDRKLRVAVHIDDLKGHKVVRAGRFLLTNKKVAWDRKVILYFQNQFSSTGDGWDKVGRNGVIKIPLDLARSRAYIEGASYTLYMYTW